MTEAERRTIYANIDKRRIRELEARVKRLEEENKALLDRVTELEGDKIAHGCVDCLRRIPRSVQSI